MRTGLWQRSAGGCSGEDVRARSIRKRAGEISMLGRYVGWFEWLIWAHLHSYRPIILLASNEIDLWEVFGGGLPKPAFTKQVLVAGVYTIGLGEDGGDTFPLALKPLDDRRLRARNRRLDPGLGQNPPMCRLPKPGGACGRRRHRGIAASTPWRSGRIGRAQRPLGTRSVRKSREPWRASPWRPLGRAPSSLARRAGRAAQPLGRRARRRAQSPLAEALQAATRQQNQTRRLRQLTAAARSPARPQHRGRPPAALFPTHCRRRRRHQQRHQSRRWPQADEGSGRMQAVVKLEPPGEVPAAKAATAAAMSLSCRWFGSRRDNRARHQG